MHHVMELFYKYCTISWNSFYKINNLGNVAATPIWKFLLDEPPDCKALSLSLFLYLVIWILNIESNSFQAFQVPKPKHFHRPRSILWLLAIYNIFDNFAVLRSMLLWWPGWNWWKLGLWCIYIKFVFHWMFARLPNKVGSSTTSHPLALEVN